MLEKFRKDGRRLLDSLVQYIKMGTQLTNDKLVLEIMNANSRSNLRGIAENTIDRTYRFMCAGNNEMAERGKAVYNNVRKDMVENGIPAQDVADYDRRFVNLPWADAGYEAPKLEALN